MRGERIFRQRRQSFDYGSSPHARGTPLPDPPCLMPMRLIPACAGNARSTALREDMGSAHPRMRGERFSRGWKRSKHGGSSPHARGTHGRVPRRVASDRLIPACAGNAGWLMRSMPTPTAHPRMRGERREMRKSSRTRSGSSPHARGTLRCRYRPSWPPRLIPACAGNAISPPAWMRISTAHPRMRGERSSQKWLIPKPDSHFNDPTD